MRSIMKFRVLRGKHSEGGRTYSVGEVVDSASDLSKHNNPTGSQKFERIQAEDDVQRLRRQAPNEIEVSPPAPPAPSFEQQMGVSEEQNDDFTDMTKSQLVQYAELNQIDLAGATTKSDILANIRATEEEKKRRP